MATWDSATGSTGMKIYIDGILSGSGSSFISPVFGGNFRLGANYNGTTPTDAFYSDLRIYNSPLDST